MTKRVKVAVVVANLAMVAILRLKNKRKIKILHQLQHKILYNMVSYPRLMVEIWI